MFNIDREDPRRGFDLSPLRGSVQERTRKPGARAPGYPLSPLRGSRQNLMVVPVHDFGRRHIITSRNLECAVD